MTVDEATGAVEVPLVMTEDEAAGAVELAFMLDSTELPCPPLPGWFDGTLPEEVAAIEPVLWEMLTPVGEVCGPGVALVMAAELAPSAELAGAVAEEAMLVGLLVALDADDEAAPELLGQVRSYRGALLRSAPTMPKDVAGALGAASWRMYHQVLTLPRREQATSFQ